MRRFYSTPERVFVKNRCILRHPSPETPNVEDVWLCTKDEEYGCTGCSSVHVWNNATGKEDRDNVDNHAKGDVTAEDQDTEVELVVHAVAAFTRNTKTTVISVRDYDKMNF